MLTNLKRVFHFALTDFSRNKGLSVAAIFVLIVTTLLVTGLFLLQGINSFLVSSIEDKIDITAYFKSDVQENDILAVKDELQQSAPEIESIEYISKERALEIFKERHAENDVFSRALQEVGDNPFLPSLNVTTKDGDAAQYENIATILDQQKFAPLLEKVDFSQKRDTIEKIFSITSTVTTVGIAIGIVLIIVAMLVVYNTIKLIIVASKEEITTMRIVGASSWFVRAPYLIEGVLFGVVSFIVCLIITGVAVYFASPVISAIMPGFNLFSFFLKNLWLVVLIQLGFGMILGVISSFIGVRKYLRV